MRVHEAVAQTLIDAGYPVMFGLLGDANMQYCANYMELGGRFIGAIHEGNAVSMADGYARETDRAAVVSVTSGPAVTNTLTALTEAVRVGSPVLILTGDVPPIRDFVQHVDLIRAADVAGAGYRRVLKADHLVHDLARALEQVGISRKPMILNIPFEILNETIEYTPSNFGTMMRKAAAPDIGELDEALGIMASANRPVILAGAGAMYAEAREDIVALAETLGAPLTTTLLAKGLFAGEPADLGVCGTVSHDVAVEVIAGADALLIFGATLNPYTAAHGDLVRGKTLIQIDTDASALGRDFPVKVGIVGDARATARAMTNALRDAEVAPAAYNGPALQKRLAERDPRTEFPAVPPAADKVDMRAAMVTLDELLPKSRSVVTDVGRFMQAPWRYMNPAGGGRFHHTVNFGSIGLGLSTGLGASLADRSDITITVAGDGGVAMGYMELITAVREKAPLVVVILNDGCYGAEYTKLRDFGLDPNYSLLNWPDPVEVARSLGCQAITVTSEEGLREAASMVEAGQLPLVIDVRADPTVDIGVLR